MLGPDFFKNDEEGNELPWNGETTPFSTTNGTVVAIPNETIQMVKWAADENRAYDAEGNPDLNAYVVTGFHVDLDLPAYGGEYAQYELSEPPSNPAHSFGE